MSNVIVCEGTLAKTPYFVSEDGINLFSIEELCYYLMTNAYILDDSFVEIHLAEWIANECSLESLGKEVGTLCGKFDALSKFVTLLSKNIGYYSAEEWEELQSAINRNTRLSLNERRKIRADGLLNAGRIVMSIDEYEKILSSSNVGEVRFRAEVYHNMGVARCRLFDFARAAKAFELAYENYPDEDNYLSMLTAYKLSLSQEDYLKYLSEHRESYEDSLEVERRCEILKTNWEAQPENKFFKEVSALKAKGNAYYDGIVSMTNELKEEYRECCRK